jgi:hypothetical protein
MLLGYLALLGGLTLLLSQETHARMFAESGPFEWASIVMWLMSGVAVFILLRRGINLSLVIAVSITTLMCAAREADLHKAFTDYSVLKIGYYIDGDFPLAQRAALGAIMMLALTALGRVVVGIANRLRTRSGPMSSWELLVVLALAIIVLTKVADRGPDVLESVFGVSVAPAAIDHVKAFEEGMEALVPLSALLAIALFVRAEARTDEDESVAAPAGVILCQVQSLAGDLPGRSGGRH